MSTPFLDILLLDLNRNLLFLKHSLIHDYIYTDYSSSVAVFQLPTANHSLKTDDPPSDVWSEGQQ